jgi:pyrroline-5-carboxylate reductase
MGETMQNKQTIGFIGGGRVVRIILMALQNNKISFGETYSYDPDQQVLEKLKAQFPYVKTSNSDLSIISDCEIVFLAVHPPVIPEVFKYLKILNKDAFFVSLAPKLKIKQITEYLEGFSRIVRMIPNAPSCIGKGYNPIALSDSITKSNMASLAELFDAMGEWPVVEEDLLEAYAIITAMGPTYFWPQINKLKELAVSFGIDKNKAEEAIGKMLTGSIKALFESGFSSDIVMDLIPVYPLKEMENHILEEYEKKLSSLFEKLKK